MLERFRELAGALDHPEGVAWGPDGKIYAGGEAGQIYAVTLEGDVEVAADTGGFIYGLALDGFGNVYACDCGRAQVARISPDGGVESYSSGTPERPMRVPNWAAFDESGNLYVTDSGEWGADDGLIYRISASGETTVWTEEALCVGCYRPDRIYRIPSGGPPEVLAEDPDGVVLNQPANVAFVGEELDRLVVSSLGGWSLMIADVGAPGLRLRYPKLPA